MELRLGIDYTGESLSQSPENGSRHCKKILRQRDSAATEKTVAIP